MKIFKNGVEAFCDKSQLDIMLKNGWSRQNTPEVAKKVEPVELDPIEPDSIEPIEDESPEGEDEETSSEGGLRKRKLLKKKKD